MLAAVDDCEQVTRGFYTGTLVADYHIERPTWPEFCLLHDIDGNRFMEIMDPVLDIWTGINQDSGKVTFRMMAEISGILNAIDMILGEQPGPDDATLPPQYLPLKIWLKFAHYLAIHTEVPIPTWMRT